MFQQPELRHDEVAFYKHIITERHGLGAEASQIKRNLEKELNRYSTGFARLEDLSYQTVIIRVRAFLTRESTGPPGYEGFYFVACLQRALQWETLAESDRKAFTHFLETEQQRYRAKAAGDPSGYRQKMMDVTTRPSDDDYIIDRASKTIPTPELMSLFVDRLAADAATQARLDATRPFCHFCGKEDNLSALKRCSKCQSVFYCNRECQAGHWKVAHKYACMFMAATKGGSP